jgi:ribosomal protein S27AE
MSESVVHRLTAYYGTKKHSDELVAGLVRFAGQIDAVHDDRLFDWITENREVMTAIGIVDLRKACLALGIPFREAGKTEKFEFICPACGTPYRYSQYVSDFDKLNRIYDRCPHCGMPGHDYFVAEDYRRMGNGKDYPAWYARTLEYYSSFKWVTSESKLVTEEAERAKYTSGMKHFFDYSKFRKDCEAERTRQMDCSETTQSLTAERRYPAKTREKTNEMLAF